MSNLPLRFLASWQAKQFSLRIGATSLMKLTGPLGAWAAAGCGTSSSNISNRPIAAQSTQKQKWDRSMGVGLLKSSVDSGRIIRRWVGLLPVGRHGRRVLLLVRKHYRGDRAWNASGKANDLRGGATLRL